MGGTGCTVARSLRGRQGRQLARLRSKIQESFLDALAGGDSVTGACLAAGLRRRTAYQWRADDPDFATAWEEAIEAGTDLLEDEARRRAVEGVEHPLMYQGRQVATVRKHSDALLMFLLKARRPEVFRERVDMRQGVDTELAQLMKEIDGRSRGLPDRPVE